ncbi:hypothetical protein [Sandaracinus amylolyticus]|nr:hypothetical protein [Sandaracinus amylolyticus]
MFRLFAVAMLCAAPVLIACGDDDGAIIPDAGPTDAGPPPPDAWMERPPAEEQRCPGDEGCTAGSDGELQAGAAALEITPVGFETFTDTNGDSKWDPESEPFDDRDGDDVFDAAWIAGFGNARAAQSVMNPQWARALVLRNGDVTIAFVALDVVGWFLDENLLIRDAVDAAGLDVDYVVVSATHVHQARDTIGIWGPTLNDTGISDDYQRYVREQSVAAIEQALAGMQRANVQYADVRLRDRGDVRRWVGDNRDPNVIDDEIRILRFVAHGTADVATPGSGTTIGTMINFASHPEYQGSRNPRLSSDWPHWMREVIEEGVEVGPEGTPVAGVGGVTVFVNGALGSQIGPNGLRIERWDGTALEGDDGDEHAAVVGTQLGVIALDAIRGEGTTLEESADLAFHRLQVYVTVENLRYQIAYGAGVFVRALYNYDETRRIGERYGNVPDVLTELALIDVGRATMLTAPGELDPAELVGGYEAPCDYTPGGCDALIDEDDENPPDLSMAPSGPFLRDRLLERRPDAEQVWLLGLTNDFLGYFVPDFDYELGAGVPYVNEAPGDHYEETNSVGIHGWPRIRAWMIRLIEAEGALGT